MEKTIQITLSELQALLEKQKENCAKIFGQSISKSTYDRILNAPLPDLSHLKEADTELPFDLAYQLQLFREVQEQYFDSELKPYNATGFGSPICTDMLLLINNLEAFARQFGAKPIAKLNVCCVALFRFR
jgi:hypothetical protein